ncbi:MULTISPECIES: hypothetical protein [unclassified Mycolicibacterium]|nr:MULTISPECIES: hypothetical protein [unclassified Mycolicibacterium]
MSSTAAVQTVMTNPGLRRGGGGGGGGGGAFHGCAGWLGIGHGPG